MKILVSIMVVLFMYSCSMSDDDEDLPNNWKYIRESGTDITIFKSSNDKLFIPYTVIEYKNNNEWLIACQVNNPWAYYPILTDSIYIAIDNPSELKFWIINLQKDIMYGPLSLNEYLKKRIELKLPKGLKLELKL